MWSVTQKPQLIQVLNISKGNWTQSTLVNTVRRLYIAQQAMGPTPPRFLLASLTRETLVNCFATPPSPPLGKETSACRLPQDYP